MRRMVNFGKELRLFGEWSKLIGLKKSYRLFGDITGPITVLLAIISFTALVFLSSLFLTGCKGLTFTEEDQGTLILTFAKGNITKAVVRDFPDSNNFILVIKAISNGNLIYNGSYGQRPAAFNLNAGTYDVKVMSRSFSYPEYETPCFSDFRTVVVEAGKKVQLAFACSQSNAGVRLMFTDGFKTRYQGYRPEMHDSCGSLLYTYTENRFAYFGPGNVVVQLREVLPEGATEEPEIIQIYTRRLYAKDMLTIKFHAYPVAQEEESCGIQIDTVSNWLYEYVVMGGTGGGDGLTKATALAVSQLSSHIASTDIWVAGYIVGGDLTSTSINFTAPFQSNTNLAIADAPSERDRNKCASVSLPQGTLRQMLNLVDNPANLGQKVWLKGTVAESYFSLVGINPLSVAEF